LRFLKKKIQEAENNKNKLKIKNKQTPERRSFLKTGLSFRLAAP